LQAGDLAAGNTARVVPEFKEGGGVDSEGFVGEIATGRFGEVAINFEEA
jgi:hypothetical protein